MLAFFYNLTSRASYTAIILCIIVVTANTVQNRSMHSLWQLFVNWLVIKPYKLVFPPDYTA